MTTHEPLMTTIRGSCYCENIILDANLSAPPKTYQPRACDCQFCIKHGAEYISDSRGTLEIHVKNVDWLKKFRQSDKGTADFLHCTNCGVLVGVIYQEGEKLYGAMNRLVIDNASFGEKQNVSPKRLSTQEKVSRWKEVWFQGVTLYTQ